MLESPSKKRKTLDDFFHRTKQVKQADHHKEKAITKTPPGLTVVEEFVTAEEEEELLSFLDQQTWRTDLARRVIHYGGTYCLMPPRDASPGTKRRIEQDIRQADSIPSEVRPVVDRMIKTGLYSTDKPPEYCIVNEYRPGQGISAHVENFRFGEPVCSLTLAGSDTMRFHELQAAHDGSVRSGKASTAPRTGIRKDVVLPRRSLAVSRGDARSKWQHEITRGRRQGSGDAAWRRVSLTFRVDKR